MGKRRMSRWSRGLVVAPWWCVAGEPGPAGAGRRGRLLTTRLRGAGLRCVWSGGTTRGRCSASKAIAAPPAPDASTHRRGRRPTTAPTPARPLPLRALSRRRLRKGRQGLRRPGPNRTTRTSQRAELHLGPLLGLTPCPAGAPPPVGVKTTPGSQQRRTVDTVQVGVLARVRTPAPTPSGLPTGYVGRPLQVRGSRMGRHQRGSQSATGCDRYPETTPDRNVLRLATQRRRAAAAQRKYRR